MSNLILAFDSLKILIPLILTSWKFYLVVFIIALPFGIYYNYKLTYKYIKWQERQKALEEERKKKEQILKNNRNDVLSMISRSVKSLSSDELRDLKKKLRESFENKFVADLKSQILDQIEEIDDQIPLTKRKEAIEQLDWDRETANERLQELE